MKKKRRIFTPKYNLKPHFRGTQTFKKRSFLLSSIALAGLLINSCGKSTRVPAYYLSQHPDDKRSRQLRHYPVARQGNLTAWVTSDHVGQAAKWLYKPENPEPAHPIVGKIRSKHMPADTKHDGSFLIVRGYQGPLFKLWDGERGEGLLYNGRNWQPIWLEQGENGVNTWVYSKTKIGSWSGFPVVIGDPIEPEAIAGAMWYRDNTNPYMGGATSSSFLANWLNKLKFENFVE